MRRRLRPKAQRILRDALAHVVSEWGFAQVAHDKGLMSYYILGAHLLTHFWQQQGPCSLCRLVPGMREALAR